MGARVGLRIKTMRRGSQSVDFLLGDSSAAGRGLGGGSGGGRSILRQKSPWGKCNNPAQALPLALARVGGGMAAATKLTGPEGE
eukprot:8893964-Pyramimonas_sp.AAC.1